MPPGGGHAGSHKDGHGESFARLPGGERVSVDGGGPDGSETSSSSSSASSDELMPDTSTGGHKRKAPPQQFNQQVAEGFYVLEIEVDPETQSFLRKHPRKAAIWLSRKMQEKGKEHFWSHLPLSRKKDFDLAQAKELSNVLHSKALRGLTKQEELNLDLKRCMKMRWVLTTKSDGSAKARLVILGFQQPNLTEVQAAAPTMNRMSRNMLLMMCANSGFKIRSGDVTSAFLQTNKSLEDEELTVWATPELAVLYGAPPDRPRLPLRVSKAFYGLVHAPREWYDDVSKTLATGGWRKLTSDGCLFTLWDDKELVGIAGIHVDDFPHRRERRQPCL